MKWKISWKYLKIGFSKCKELVFEHNKAVFSNEALYNKLSYKVNKKYIRVCDNSSAWAFIDKENGDVLKPASFKTPAKGSRGNIFDKHNGMKYITAYGPAYLNK